MVIHFGGTGEQRFGVRLSPAEAVALRDFLILQHPLKAPTATDPTNPAYAAQAVAASYGAGVR